ncbi:MAG TPA: hypothetical protein PKW95_16745 [bacterium]|nr:hypothetical protein [bacterium]
MKHHLIFTGSGPIVVLHSYGDISDETLLAKLTAKGIEKFIAFELDGDELRHTYGHRYEVVVEDLDETNDFRILDYDGHRVMNHFDFAQITKQKPYFHG